MDNKDRGGLEILAPAGSMDCLAAAVRAGADSVYFGAGGLNMRSASSANFGPGDLRHIVRLAAGAGVRTYLTANSVLYDADLPEMRRILDAAREAGVSAVIASDQAAIAYASSIGMELHLSTQLNISNLESLRFYARWADVALLARELSLDQVSAICRAVKAEPILGPSGRPLRIELFAHGAMCMAVSGKCYLSLQQYGRSANRGECLQACRRSYLVTDLQTGDELEVENKFIMSPKDLKTIHFLDRIAAAGVGVLKIEGRARSPEYVSTCVSCYREAASSLADGSYGPEKVREWDERLSRVFNRGFWDGYYLGRRLGEWTSAYGSAAERRRLYVGRCVNWWREAGAASFLVEGERLSTGDEILITGPSTGALEMAAAGLMVDGLPAGLAGKGSEVSFLVGRKVRRGDRLYRMVPA